MKTAREYASEYRKIASNLGYQGDSVELLVQMLAHFSYTNEVENIAYTLEGSLERATQDNSKIQLCVEQMYSVFRGRCPRVILRFRPTKFFEFALYDKVFSGNSFTLYYLGYVPGESDTTGTDSGAFEVSQAATGSMKFTYAPVSIAPSEAGYVTIVCLLAKETVKSSHTFTEDNIYYHDVLEENLSSDLWVKIGTVTEGTEMSYIPTTREFQKHLLDSYVYDLTLPSWGTRLYLPESYREANTKIEVGSFKFCKTSDFSSFDLGNIKIQGGELIGFQDLSGDLSEVTSGVILLPEVSHEDLSLIHYKASQDRYMGSIFKSNSDVSDLLKEMYPEKVSGTSWKFVNTPDKVYLTEISKILEGYTLQSNITSYTSPVTLQKGSNLDFKVNPETTEWIKIGITETNSTTPDTTVYGIHTENPVFKMSETTSVYVTKTSLDSDGDLVTEVISDLDTEGLRLTYRYSESESWTDVPASGLIPVPPVTETTTGGSDSSTSESKATSTTVTTDAEGKKTTSVTTSESSTSLSSESQADIEKTVGPKYTEPLQIRLFSKNTNRIEDQEQIPYVTADTTYFGIVDRNYTIPLNKNLESILGWPVQIESTLFVSGEFVTAESYEILSHSKELGVSVTDTGVIVLESLKVDSIGTYTIVLGARYKGLMYTSTLTVGTTAIEASRPRILELFRKTGDTTYSKLSEYKVHSGDTIEIGNISELLGSYEADPENPEVVLGINSKDFLTSTASDVKKSSTTSSSTTTSVAITPSVEKIVSGVISSATVTPVKTTTTTTLSTGRVVVNKTGTTLTPILSGSTASSTLSTNAAPLRTPPTPPARLATATFITKTTSSASTTSLSTIKKLTSVKTVATAAKATTVVTSSTTSSTTTSAADTATTDREQVDDTIKTITLGSVEIKSTTETADSVQARTDFVPELKIYYIPQNSSDLLSDVEKTEFLETRGAYYITDNISIDRGNLYNITLDLNATLYQNTSISDEVSEILSKFQGTFGLDLDNLEEDLRAQIGKISNIAKIKGFGLSWRTETGELLDFSGVSSVTDLVDPRTSYLNIVSYISTDII